MRPETRSLDARPGTRPNWALAFFAGVVGAVIMTILFAVGRAVDIPFNLAMILGSWVTLEVGVGTWILGFVMHVILGGLFGMIYASFFHGWRRADWMAGIALSIPHIVIAGFFFWVLPYVHGAIPEHPAFPYLGFLAWNYGGWVFLELIVLHLIYGAVVGEIYRERPARIVDEPARRTTATMTRVETRGPEPL